MAAPTVEFPFRYYIDDHHPYPYSEIREICLVSGEKIDTVFWPAWKRPPTTSMPMIVSEPELHMALCWSLKVPWNLLSVIEAGDGILQVVKSATCCMTGVFFMEFELLSYFLL